MATTAHLTAEQLHALTRYGSPTVANAIETFKVRPRQEGNLASGIRALFPEQGPLVGYAVPVLIRAEPAPAEGHRASTFAWWDYIQSIPGPRVVVAHDLDEPRGQGTSGVRCRPRSIKPLGASG